MSAEPGWGPEGAAPELTSAVWGAWEALDDLRRGALPREAGPLPAALLERIIAAFDEFAWEVGVDLEDDDTRQVV